MQAYKKTEKQKKKAKRFMKTFELIFADKTARIQSKCS